MLNFIQNISKIKIPFFSSLDICFDFGTANTRIAIKGKGTVLSEPTYIGLNIKTNEYIFYGKEAKEIIGKTPEFVKIVRPVVNGVVSDFDAAVALLRNYIYLSVHPYLNKYSFLKPTLNAISTVPHRATEIEQRALEEVFSKLGFSSTYLIEEPLACASGAGLNILSHSPHLIVNIGSGLTTLSVISGGGVVIEKTLRYGGDHMNQLIANYIYLKFGVIVGDSTCEALKIQLLSFNEENKTSLVRGKSLENGLPKSIRIKSSDIKEALINIFMQIADGVKELIEMSPPEVVDDIYTSGIILTGGIAQIPNIKSYFSDELKIKCRVAENPLDEAIIGLQKIAKSEDLLRRVAIPKI